jgi:hypothetical protein
MFAQALVEYALLQAASVAGRASFSVSNWFLTGGPERYLFIGAVLLAFLWLWKRRP